MLSGSFNNCYGIRELQLSDINFHSCNKAIIYAPNGVMKTSFSKVFEDLSNGQAPKDRIFDGQITSYSIKYHGSAHEYSSANPDIIPCSDKVYVINSFADKFEFTKETVSTLLADEETRSQYNTLMAEFGTEVKQIEADLSRLTGLSKLKIKGKLIEDFNLSNTSDWPDIIEKIKEEMAEYQEFGFLTDLAYINLFNDKTVDVYSKPEFKNYIESYINQLDILLSESQVLTRAFTDRSAEALSKVFTKNNLFAANHTIHLCDGCVISSLEEWNQLVSAQIEKLYSDPVLKTEFEKLKKILTSNEEVSVLRNIIINHQEIIPHLSDISALKIQIWLSCFNRLEHPFDDYYYPKFSQYTQIIHELYEKAAAQSERWTSVVAEFNRRFRVPFKIEIKNKANFLLKDEAPNLIFKYSRGEGDNRQEAELKKDNLMIPLSMGEKRALYLLYILFDMDRIMKQAESSGERVLIIADDVADSFDYKNKYAIIECLNDWSKNSNIDLLMLTHNFDFYRTIKFRLNVSRQNCLIAQRNLNGILNISEFRYQKDFFKNVVIEKIKSGNIDSDVKKKLLIASIPFYRNLTEYAGDDEEYLKLTCFLHYKTAPIDTSTATVSDLWDIVKKYLNNVNITTNSGNYYSTIQDLANNILSEVSDEVSLENKLVLSIACRLAAEKFMKDRIIANEGSCPDGTSNQTREWSNKAIPYLNDNEKALIDEINLITPENIHLNAFMFEPLIDISDWTLKDMYSRVMNL